MLLSLIHSLYMFKPYIPFVTARVRSTREGNVLTRVCPSIHPQICLSTGGGQVQLAGGGQVQLPGEGSGPARGGVRSSCRGVGQVQPAGGVGGSGQAAGGVRSSQRGGQVQPEGGWVRSSWWGGQVQPGRVRSSCRGGGSAKIGQQNEYSLHGGRYASCVHAGGLSCIEHDNAHRRCH